MVSYILRRILSGIVLAVLVTFITYALLSPSFDAIVRAVVGGSASDETVAALTTKYGFDRPLIVQYGDWLFSALQGDLGRSLFTSEPVGPAVAQRLSVTLSIVLVALAITLVVSVALGVVAAVRGGVIDRIAQSVSLIGFLIPSLLLAILLVLILAITLKIFPATGYTPPGENFGRYLSTIAIPVIVLVVAGIANMAAQVRGTMIGELRKDYVRSLRARGVPYRSVVLRHALRNAAGPALTVLGLEFLTMLGASLFIEKVFALPGYGTFAFTAALRGDVPVIMGITGFTVLLTVVINLIIDLAYGWLIPKARVR